MNLDLFMTGVKIGLSVAMPVGPICLLCIRKSLSDTLAIGIALALGVATADVIYAVLGAVSVTTIHSWLNEYKFFIELLGAAVIIYLGIITLKNGIPQNKSVSCSTTTLLQTYFSIIAITLTSPMTIALFAGIFAGFGAELDMSNYNNIAQLSAGVFISTTLWFTLLSALVIFFKSWFNQEHLAWVNRIAGVLILGFGLQRLYNIIYPA